jgi:hypothetical protein
MIPPYKQRAFTIKQWGTVVNFGNWQACFQYHPVFKNADNE